MITQSRFTLREAADALELESWRLSRLGRYLRIMPDTRCLPTEVVTRAQTEGDEEERYRVVLNWLLSDLRGESPGKIV